MVQGPPFGCAQNSLRCSVQEQAEVLEQLDGYAVNQYYRKRNITQSETTETLDAWGIAPSTHSTHNPFDVALTSVSMSETEMTVMHESWNQVDPDTDIDNQVQPLVGVDACLIFRVEQRWTISGLGAVPTEPTRNRPWQVGDNVETALNFGSATGGNSPDFVITVPVGAQLRELSIQRENTAFQTFNMTFVRYLAQTNADATTHILSIPTFINTSILADDLDEAGKLFKISKESSLTAEGFASVTTTVEIYDPLDIQP